MAKNAVAANVLMLILIVGGLVTLGSGIKQEVFPEVDLDVVVVDVVYPGASPAEVEQAVVLAIEEAIRGVDGIKKVRSTAREGYATASAELVLGTKQDRALNDVKSAVDRITSFPADVERPTVSILAPRQQAISIVLYGDVDEAALRAVAEDSRRGAAGEVVRDRRVVAFVGGGTLLFLVGAWDDRYYLNAWQKLPVQIVAGALAIWAGFTIDYFTNPFTLTTHDVPVWISWSITLFWIVGVTNAMNLIDGLDGLAAGIGAIISGTLAVICWQAGQMTGVVVAVAMLGALIGYLPFNFPPARIFLGDAGALFIGYALALVSLQGYRKAALLSFIVPLLALAVPLLDTALSIIRRLRMGRGIFHADRLHMHHRLLEKEGSHRRAVLWLYFQTACFSVIAVSFAQLSGYSALVFLAAVVILTVRLLRNLGLFSIDMEAAGVEGTTDAAKGENT